MRKKSKFKFLILKTRSARAFTLIEMLVVVAVIGFIASAIFATLTGAQLDAQDKRRITDLKSIQTALNSYYTDYNSYPREADGANGNMSTNTVFLNLMKPKYLSGTPVDPMGIGDPTYYYYYDGSHSCGGKEYVVIFVRQLSKASNSNYNQFLNDTCLGAVDGEGRGGGVNSYNLIIGNSNG